MSLGDWLEKGWLVTHRPDRREIQELLGVANRDIADSQAKGTSNDTRLSLAYNAALQPAVAGLAASGYRAGRAAPSPRLASSIPATSRAAFPR